MVLFLHENLSIIEIIRSTLATYGSVISTLGNSGRGRLVGSFLIDFTSKAAGTPSSFKFS